MTTEWEAEGRDHERIGTKKLRSEWDHVKVRSCEQ